MVYHQYEKTNLLLIINLLALVYAKNEQYAGWKSYYVGATSKEQVENLYTLRTTLDLDFLSPAHVQREAIVLVKPKQQEEFIKNLDKLNIKYKIHADNVKSALDHDDEMIKEWKQTITRQGGSTMPYNSYQPLKIIYSYMNGIAKKYKNITTLVTTGPTSNGRVIKYMKISSTHFQDIGKPIIFIDAAIHAREWITPPVITWAIKKLTEDLTEPELLNDYDWILLPIVNPDGYEFTFNKDRLWRKTRCPNKHLKNGKCPGVDGNRNYDAEWGIFGTSKDPCSVVYGGAHAFSEVETRAVRDILLEYRTRIALYISLHSQGSYIVYPWAHNFTAPPNHEAIHSVAIAMADAIYNRTQAEFPRYVVGSAAFIMYQSSGDSIDYAHKLGIPFTYIFELPGLLEGHLLNPKHIEQVCRETWAGFVVGAQNVKRLIGSNKTEITNGQ